MVKLNRLKKFVLTGALSACSLAAQGSERSVKALAWLAGDWGPTNAAVASEEHWLPPLGGMMLGLSRTIVRERTVAFEFLRIEERPDGIYYVAQPGGRPPVAFKLTSVTADSVVFENPQHDHPKIISYRLEGPELLVATIEGDEGGKHKKQAFSFRKVTGGK